jgi:hypothetical protein
MTQRIPTNNYANHFDPSKSHHLAFLQGLLDRVDELDPVALQPGGDLRDIWVAAVPSKTPLVSLAPPQGPSGWAEIASMAKTAGAKFPELVAAQWALESGWGKHTSGRNNYFGLKGAGTKTKTQEFVNGKWIEITDSFIDFATPNDCVKYLFDTWYKDF